MRDPYHGGDGRGGRPAPGVALISGGFDMGIERSRLCAALLALATTATGLVVTLGAAPAQAGWTDVSGTTRYRICKEATPSAKGWIFLTRVRKRAGTEDARAGAVLYAGDKPRHRWSSGWLDDGEVARGQVRIKRQGRIRVHVWQEAGDVDSPIGTALERAVLRPRDIDRCG